ncbi:MAG: LysR substrate-binding domain-containing protein [Cyanobacteria bacterium P01_F01_bin.86]
MGSSRNRDGIASLHQHRQPTMIGLVAAGIGVAFVAASLQSITRPGVVYRALQEEAPMLKLTIAWQETAQSPVLQSFLREVDEWYGSLNC